MSSDSDLSGEDAWQEDREREFAAMQELLDRSPEGVARAAAEAADELARMADLERRWAAVGGDIWGRALTECGVPATVRPAIELGPAPQVSLHVVPLEDAVSGQSRLHPAGLALCEPPGELQSRLELGEPVGHTVMADYAMCQPCQALAPGTRAAASSPGLALEFPAPPGPRAGPRAQPGPGARTAPRAATARPGSLPPGAGRG